MRSSWLGWRSFWNCWRAILISARSATETPGLFTSRKWIFWECPAGRQLLRTETDYQRRIVHYRAPADACNACSLKNNCTDSNDGRLLKSHLDSWVESELRRFHRGISLVLLLLATIILVAVSVRHASPRELLIVGALLLPVGLAETKLFASFLTHQRA